MAIPAIGAIAMAAVRVVGGITGAGAKSVQKIYRQTGPTKSQKNDMRHEMGFEQDKAMEKIYKEHLKKMGN